MKHFKPPHKVDKYGYPIDPEMRRLQKRLGTLAAEFRGTVQDKSDERQKSILNEYHETMDTLYKLGWDDILDFTAELPDYYMPEEYLRRHPTLDW